MHTVYLPRIGTALKLRDKLLVTKPIEQTQTLHAKPKFLNSTKLLLSRLLQVRLTISK